MPKPLTYQRFSNDVFMLLCRAETPVKDMPEHPVIKELDEQLDEVRECDHIRTGFPYGPLTKPRAWRGCFTIGTCKFQVKSIYAFPKFFGLICDTESGTHDPVEIQAFVAEVNAAVAADLGLDRLG